MSGENPDENYCFFLDPRVQYVRGRSPESHKCNLNPGRSCVGTTYTNDYGDEFWEVELLVIKNCPLFTTNPDLAKRVKEALKSLPPLQ